LRSSSSWEIRKVIIEDIFKVLEPQGNHQGPDPIKVIGPGKFLSFVSRDIKLKLEWGRIVGGGGGGAFSSAALPLLSPI